MKKNKNIIKEIILFLSITVILLNNFATLAAIVSDNDGSAFVTKAEFDTLKKSFNKQVDDYKASIDGKIDGAIASYLAGLRLATSINTESLLNNFGQERRTFVSVISNPTTSDQSNVRITTNGFWIMVYLAEGANWVAGRYYGYSFAGLNNSRGGGHEKNPIEANNGQLGQYLFTDLYDISGIKYPYFRENKLYLLTYAVRSFGSLFDDGNVTSPLTYGGPSSLSWTGDEHRYNWIGTNNRTCASGKTLSAVESLSLMKDEISTIDWIDNMCGSSIFTTETGTLLNEDEFYWSYYMNGFSCGKTAQQAYFLKCDNSTYVSNSYNDLSKNTKIPLYFYVPKITKYKGNNICVYDVMTALSQPVYYYSGLPLCTMPSKGKLRVDLNIVRNFASATDKTSTVTLAIKSSQFANTDLGSETNLLFIKTYTATELNASTKVIIEMSEETLEGLQNKTLWIKACASNSNDSVTLSTDAITCITE